VDRLIGVWEGTWIDTGGNDWRFRLPCGSDFRPLSSSPLG
jgi:hypothetical protein